MQIFPYSKQKIFNRDVRYISKVLKSDYITQGPIVRKFEKAMSLPIYPDIKIKDQEKL